MNRKLHQAILAGSMFLGAVGATAQTAPDSNQVNQHDRSSSQLIRDQAKGNLSDHQIVHVIRKAVIDDKSLSVDGHHARITSEHGRVTLEGPVYSEEESRFIEARA